ncbi:cytochrome P450 [Clostridium guangxiense]|uniref:cytochrome P450 n=1 Tax=Clostridium guangxiense TaxID=1662055 RepID=UPI0022AB3E2D|nr:cytochrome P450 [Clostridium guangxiense]
MTIDEQVVHDKGLDNTLDLLHEGYTFIKNTMDFYRCDIFETHLFGEKVICITGEEAAKIFYDEERFQRKDAAPKRIQKTLFGMNAIQTMDGKAHTHRKLFFMSLMTEKHQKKLAELMLEALQASAYEWESIKKIVLFDEVKNILCKIACRWTGVPLPEFKIKNLADDFSAMVDGFGGIGPRYWKGKNARTRTERWAKGIIEDVRGGKLTVKNDSLLYAMAFYREIDGNLMCSEMAAVELINLLRPVVAISTYITFAALALYKHPECKKKLVTDDNNYIEMFVQEVRRYYPFTPFLGARVRKDFTWSGLEFEKGMLVLLDIYGINHDSKIWGNPDEFQPERFENKKDRLFSFMPQGGGKASEGHRCPGEGITIEIMKVSLDFLVNKLEFDIPKQDLSYNLARIPTLPHSGFIMSNIKRKS